MPSVLSEQQRRDVSVEIFELTGEKVDVSDPVIMAALFYSEKLRGVCDRHESTVKRLQGDLEATFDRAVERAYQEITHLAAAERKAGARELQVMLSAARQAASSQVPSIKRELEAHAATLQNARSSSSARPGVYVPTGSLIWCGLLLVIAGFIAGYLWFGAPRTRSGATGVAIGARSIPDSEQLPRGEHGKR